MPKTRIRGFGIKFDTDPPKICQRLEFEDLVSYLTPILRINAKDSNTRDWYQICYRSSEKIPKTQTRGIGIKFDTDPPKKFQLTRIRGIGIKFDTDPPRKCQRLEFEDLVSNLTPILRKYAKDSNSRIWYHI